MSAEARRAETLAALITHQATAGLDRVDPYLMLAQAELESGRFTSRLTVEENNAWGMMRPRVRPTTAVGETALGFAVYNSLSEGARDYLLRQQHFNIPNTDDPEEYIRATVASRYAEDPQYAAKWRALYVPGQPRPDGGGLAFPTQPPPPIDQAGGGINLLLLAAIAYLLTR
jgi:hypothetical protein